MSTLSISAAITAIALRLSEAGIKNSRLEAELFVFSVLGVTREWLLLHSQETLSPTQGQAIDSLVERRARREPLPYLLGWAEFYSLRFKVTPAAIVPRPETEILVEAAIHRARQNKARLALDVGTGCGVIAVIMAQEVSDLHVIGVDISPDALRLARENAHIYGVSNRLWLLCGDLLSSLRVSADCIVANLPYIASNEFPQLQPEVRDYELRLALDGGEDGLDLIRRLVVQLLDHIRPDGFAALEVGAGQAEVTANLISNQGLSQIEIIKDYAGIDRVVIVRRDR